MRLTMILVAIAGLLSPTLAHAQEACDKRLDKALSKPVEKRLEVLEKTAERCPEHVPTLTAIGHLLVDGQSDLSQEWLSEAIGYYQRASTLDPSNVDAHWWIGMLWEYAGAYEKAIPHYQWLVKASELPAERQATAKAHLVTCQFLASMRPESEEDESLGEDHIRKRSGWEEFKNVVAETALAAGLTSAGGEGAHIQLALGLLTDWLESPAEAKVETRNRFLAGMVGTIASIVAEKGLGQLIPGALNWPSPGFAGSLEDEFRSNKPPEYKTIEIGEEAGKAVVTVKLDVPRLAGSWTVTSSAGQCSGSMKWEGSGSYLSRITQDGQQIEVANAAVGGDLSCTIDGLKMRCNGQGIGGLPSAATEMHCQIEGGGATISCKHRWSGRGMECTSKLLLSR